MRFGATLFISALLLFIVQPLAGRMLLPEFGGSALVWNTSMVFFQAVLLLGYLYAHFSTRLLGVRRQAWLHIGLHLFALAWLPFSFSVAASDGPPIWQVLTMLAGGLGVPFFVLSSNAPTLQHWYAGSNSADAHEPYRLYAASNAGSLLALLAYPVAIEPWTGLKNQTIIWTSVFAVVIVGLASCAWQTQATSDVEAPPRKTPTPLWIDRLKWILWAAIPSSLLLGTTTFLTTDIAALPLLWVLPLAAYLASFVVAFSRRRIISTQNAHRAAMVLILIVVGQFAAGAYAHVWLAIPVHLLCLFAIALAFHQSLVDRRPAADHLTDFYVWMSVGGVIGGAFNAFAAPVLFDRAFEYPLVLAIALVVAGIKIPRLEVSVRHLIVISCLILFVEGVLFALGAFSASTPTRIVALAAAGAIPLFFWFRSPLVAALAVGISMIGLSWNPFEEHVDQRIRSPYGIYKIVEKETVLGKQKMLMHGRINHGTQAREAELQRLPGTYYSLRSPVGQAFEMLRATHDTSPIGVVGLGIGTLATYAQPGQVFDFFEIDPVIVKIAQDESNFSYLSQSAGAISIHVGDGRKLVEKQPATSYQMLVLDAYSSDSIPVHLLTTEALTAYMSKVKDGGWLLFHVTNGHVEVGQIVMNAAHSLGWASAQQEYWPRERQEIEIGVSVNAWVVVAKTDDDLDALISTGRWQAATPDSRPVWTDDYANILPYWD
jgi:hypothetical protein